MGKTKKSTIEKDRNKKKEVRKRRENGDQEIVETILEKIWTKEKEETKKKIEESRYNNYYKEIWTVNLPDYLQGRKKKKDNSKIQMWKRTKEKPALERNRGQNM